MKRLVLLGVWGSLFCHTFVWSSEATAALVRLNQEFSQLADILAKGQAEVALQQEASEALDSKLDELKMLIKTFPVDYQAALDKQPAKAMKLVNAMSRFEEKVAELGALGERTGVELSDKQKKRFDAIASEFHKSNFSDVPLKQVKDRIETDLQKIIQVASRKQTVSPQTLAATVIAKAAKKIKTVPVTPESAESIAARKEAEREAAKERGLQLARTKWAEESAQKVIVNMEKIIDDYRSAAGGKNLKEIRERFQEMKQAFEKQKVEVGKIDASLLGEGTKKSLQDFEETVGALQVAVQKLENQESMQSAQQKIDQQLAVLQQLLTQFKTERVSITKEVKDKIQRAQRLLVLFEQFLKDFELKQKEIAGKFLTREQVEKLNLMKNEYEEVQLARSGLEEVLRPSKA